MSGHKRATVTISQEEYRRLYEAEQRNYYDLLAIPEDILADSRLNQETQINHVYENLVTRQQKYQQLLQYLDTKLQEVEISTAQRLIDTQADVLTRYLHESEGWFLETHRKIEQYQKEFSQKIETEQERFQQEIHKQQRSLQKIEAFQTMAQETALEWIQNTADLINFIHQEYPPEMIDITAETMMLQQAIENYQTGLFESCITLCQTTFSQLTKLRLQAEKKIGLIQTLSISIEQSLNWLIERINSNQQVQAIDQDGKFLDAFVDVDYWTNGKLSELLEEVQTVQYELQQNSYSFSENTLVEILEKKIPEWSSFLVDIVHEARRSALNAQIRYSLAHLILEAAVSQGYKPVHGEYEENDFRRGYITRAVGVDGSEIRIKIDPLENLSFSMTLENRPGSLFSEEEMKKRMMELFQSVRHSGFNLGKIEPIQLLSKTSEEEFAEPIRVRRPVNR
jgi:hypothetical protein